MAFKLPEVFDVYTKVDGRRVKGSYAFVLGLTVYYKGDAENVRRPEREEDVPVVARQVLEGLVRKRKAQTGAAPDNLPAPVRRAATAYLDSFDDDMAVRRLVSSFGDFQTNPESHDQVSCLLLNALVPIVPCWADLCDDRAPVETHRRLKEWYIDRARPVDWEDAEKIAVGRRNGEVISDCDACRVEPVARAVAACAKFIHKADVSNAVDAICNADYAHAEGCWPRQEERSFQRWLVEEAVPKACRRELIA
ncbi:MAG: hypothetical protein ACO1RT_10170 [Planctomycetaceae bacterium]